MAEPDDSLTAQESVSIEKLQASADAAATQVGRLYVAFLLFGLYLAITVGSHTHEQILLEAPVKLPLLEAEIPLPAFYLIAPFLYVLVYFNFLLQLYLLAQQLWRLDLAIEQQIPLQSARETQRKSLHTLAFSHMLIGRHHSALIRFLLRIIILTTVISVPAITLLIVQASYMPLRESFTTNWHRMLVALTLLSLLLLWPHITSGSDARRAKRIRQQRNQNHELRGIPKYSVGISDFASPFVGLAMLSTMCISLSFFIIVHSDKQRDQASYFARLSYLNLEGADLQGMNLAGLNFDYSDLRRANLQGATLREANLQGADLEFANLQGADLLDANLQGAHLVGADLQGASLLGVNLQGAILLSANAQGANFSLADLSGANLRRAGLQGANFSGASLEGASLFGAQLHGAFMSCQLVEEKLKCTSLKGADLRIAHLWGVRLDDRQDLSDRWSLVDLREVNIDSIEIPNVVIQEATRGVLDERTRSRIAEGLRWALQDGDLPAVPSFPQAWRFGPNVMFHEGDPLAQRLGWGPHAWEVVADFPPGLVPRLRVLGKVDAYDRDLSDFLGELACGGSDATVHIAWGLAERARWDDGRLYAKLLAERLLDDCPPAAGLPEVLRDRLRELAGH